MKSMKSIFSILGLTLVSLVLFQNCGDADFNVEDFNSEAPAPVVQADPAKPTIIMTNASANIFTGTNANIQFSVETKDEFYYELTKGNVLLASDTLPAGTVTYPIGSVTPTSAGVYNILVKDVNDNEVTATYSLTVRTRPAPAVSVILSQTYGTCYAAVATAPINCWFGTTNTTKTLTATASTSAPATGVRWYLNNVLLSRCNNTKTCNITSTEVIVGTNILKATAKTDVWGAPGTGTKNIVVTAIIISF